MYTNLTEIKKQLNIDTTFTDDDTLLTRLLQVAEMTVEKHICSDLRDMEVEGGVLPAPLLQAIYLYAGVLYNSREAVAFGGSPVEVPLTYNYLLDLYRNYSDTTSSEFYANILDEVAKATRIATDPINYGDVVIDGDEKPAISVYDKAVKRAKEDAINNNIGFLVTV